MLRGSGARTTAGKCFLIDDDRNDQEIFVMAVVPGCIFVDVNKRKLNGIECLEIRNVSRLRAVPVCMFSTSSDPNIVRQSLQVGASDFIVKPSNISVLREQRSGFINSNCSFS